MQALRVGGDGSAEFAVRITTLDVNRLRVTIRDGEVVRTVVEVLPIARTCS